MKSPAELPSPLHCTSTADPVAQAAMHSSADAVSGLWSQIGEGRAMSPVFPPWTQRPFPFISTLATQWRLQGIPEKASRLSQRDVGSP